MRAKSVKMKMLNRVKEKKQEWDAKRTTKWRDVKMVRRSDQAPRLSRYEMGRLSAIAKVASKDADWIFTKLSLRESLPDFLSRGLLRGLLCRLLGRHGERQLFREGWSETGPVSSSTTKHHQKSEKTKYVFL